MNKTTLTIGIPAYNEEANIGLLLRDVFSQNLHGLKLEEVFVYSDGSTDRTEKIVSKYKGKVKLITSYKRKGIAQGLNKLISLSKSDIFVALDADIRITDKDFVFKLVLPLLENKADLTSSVIYPVKPRTLVSKSLFLSMTIKLQLFRSINRGSNVYTCFGLARAFSKRFYSKVHFPVSIGNDMYSYFLCKKLGFTFMSVPNAVAKYGLPTNFDDHKKQSTRFVATGNELKKLFNKDIVIRETKIPVRTLVQMLPFILIQIVRKPHLAALYAAIQLRIKFFGSIQTQNTWEIAFSSKKYYE